VAAVAVAGATGGVVALTRGRSPRRSAPFAAQVAAEAPTTQLARPAPEVGNVVPGPVNGLPFTRDEAKAWQGRRPLAVIIENSTDARPQSGLSEADVVYEALAEGGITRYLALYVTNTDAVRVGPVRSVRVYFLDWLEEYGAVAVHVGGNYHALDRIGPEAVPDLDQSYTGGTTFERTSDRVAPHNVYTSTDRLWAAADAAGYGPPLEFESWTFKGDAAYGEAASVRTLRLGFLGDPGYVVDWTYSPTDNSYRRAVGGKPDIDRGNTTQVKAKTVIVQEVPYQFFGRESALDMGDIGTGKAHILMDGTEIEATWTKPSTTGRTVFTDAGGRPVPINRGQVWVEVVPPGSAVTF